MRTKTTSPGKDARVRGTDNLPPRISVRVAARLCDCHVSYLHKTIRDQPGLLGEERIEGDRNWTLSRVAVKRFADQIAKNRVSSRRGPKKH